VNNLAAERDGNLLRIAVNGTRLGTFTDASPLSGSRFGVINWASQFDTAIADFDNVAVAAWDADVTAVGAADAPSAAGFLPASLEGLPSKRIE